jgi:hypothetical protein
MPRYYFPVRVDGLFESDPEGTEFPDVAAARSDAISACGEMLRDLNGRFAAGSQWEMDVTDEAGRALLTFRFSESRHP